MLEQNRDNFIAEMLCIADTDWVLGHWYIKVMLNGRSLTDCTAFAGMAQDTLGHTRALFRFLEDEFDLPEHQLEFGRQPNQIHDMEMLSAPPENWGDFLLTSFIAEGAIWQMLNTFRASTHPGVAGMVAHFGKELYFHRLGLEGWLKSATDEDRSNMQDALNNRLPLALRWFDDAARSANDELASSGLRSTSVVDAKAAFIETTVSKLLIALEIDDTTSLTTDEQVDWDSVRRRTRGSELPATLWEFMIPTDDDTVTLRRPLSISVDDNLDLFDRAEYAQDD
jgi:1,2-phenylacetyl-CoA epoxidase catalytic subunit